MPLSDRIANFTDPPSQRRHAPTPAPRPNPALDNPVYKSAGLNWWVVAAFVIVVLLIGMALADPQGVREIWFGLAGAFPSH